MIRQLPLPLPHHSAMGAEDFLVTSSNRDAMAWVEKWPHWPSHGLILSGHAGSGKTHLLNLWLERSNGVVITHRALHENDAAMLTSISLSLAIDDVDELAGNSKAEESLFHLYNHIKEARGSLLLTSTTGAGQAGFQLPDLRSRLLTLPAASLYTPDDALLAALIIKQFRDRQIQLDTGVVTYVASHAARDAATIREIVDKLDQAALAEGRKITVALARKILEGSYD